MKAPGPEFPTASRTFLARLGRHTGQHPLWWVGGWVVAALLCFAVAVGGVTGESLFKRLTSGEPRVPGQSQTARDIIESVEPSLDNVMLQVAGAPLDDPRAVAAATAASAGLMDVPGVVSVRSPLLSPKGLDDPEVRPLLADGTPESGRFLTIVDLDDGLSDSELDTARSAVEARLADLAQALPGATGSVGSYHHVLEAVTGTIERDLVRGEGIALPLTFLVMIFVFGGFVAAGMPIAGAIISIGGALLSLFAFSHALDLDATVVNIVTLLGLGLSIDYGLLTVNRFREELATIAPSRSPTREEVVLAAERTVATAGPDRPLLGHHRGDRPFWSAHLRGGDHAGDRPRRRQRRARGDGRGRHARAGACGARRQAPEPQGVAGGRGHRCVLPARGRCPAPTRRRHPHGRGLPRRQRLCRRSTCGSPPPARSCSP